MQNGKIGQASTESLDVNRRQVNSESDPFTGDRYRQFASHLPQRELRILDCGCNTGRGGYILRQAIPGAKLFGVDLLPERINQIPGGIYQQTVATSAASLPFDNNFFDAIVAGEFVEHVNDPDLLATFGEFRRVLKSNGTILLTTPNPNAYLVKLGRTHIFDEPSHVNIMSPGLLKAKLARCGLRLTKVLGSGRSFRYVGEQFPLFGVYGSYLAVVTQ